MLFLGYENKIRRHFHYGEPTPNLFDPSSDCLLAPVQLQRLEERLLSPFGKSDSLSNILHTCTDPLRLFDELLAHRKFASAHHLCLYIESDPDLLLSVSNKPGPHPAVFRLFFMLKGVQAATEGGLYNSALSQLSSAARLVSALVSLRPAEEVISIINLLHANLFILWGRFYQLYKLPDLSREKLREALRLFHEAGLDPPPDFQLLLVRAQLDRNDGGISAQHKLDTYRIAEPLAGGIYGPYVEHYFYSLKSRVAQKVGDCTAALTFLDRSRGALLKIAHRGQQDPVRAAVLDLLEARIFAHMALQSSSQIHQDTAIRLFLRARCQFRAVSFLPGEYLSIRDRALFSEAVEPYTPYPALRELFKSVRTFAERTQVPGFELEARYHFARISCKMGALDSAACELSAVLPLLDSTQAAPERLNDLPIHHEVQLLLEKTKDWDRNAVDPDHRWGASEYAAQELSFVLHAASRKTRSPIVLAGGRGSHPFLLVGRINQLRGTPTRQLATIAMKRRTMVELSESISRGIRNHDALVFTDFDGAPSALQDAALRASAHTDTYLILTRSLSVCRQEARVSQLHASQLADKCWLIKPLLERPEDVLPLSRGFLVQALLNRALSDDTYRQRLPKLSFTGQAAAMIFEWFVRSSLRALYEAMHTLATQIRMDVDLVEFPDGRYRVTHEALTRHMGFTTRNGPYASTLRGSGEIESGRKILEARPATIQAMAIRFGGNLTAVAKASGVPRSTITKHWSSSGLMDVWLAAGGRRKSRTPRRTTGGTLLQERNADRVS